MFTLEAVTVLRSRTVPLLVMACDCVLAVRLNPLICMQLVAVEPVNSRSSFVRPHCVHTCCVWLLCRCSVLF